MICREDLQGRLDHLFEDFETIKVLEAGGGANSFVKWPGSASLTAIDISQEQLEKNAYAEEKILGDIETYDFGGRRFDVIVCWDVLEHLDDPRKAVDRLAGMLRTDDLFIICSPIVNSAKGLITKFSPHWFHIFAYRYFFGARNAGKPGFAPFPTTHRFFISPKNLVAFGRSKGLQLEYYREFESAHIADVKKRSLLCYCIYRAVAAFLKAVSFGWVKSDSTDFHLVFKRQSYSCSKCASDKAGRFQWDPPRRNPSPRRACSGRSRHRPFGRAR